MQFQAVPTISILVMFLNIFICFGIPIVLFIFFKKRGAKISFFIFGCVSFTLFVLVLEALLHNVVLYGAYGGKITQNIWLYAIYGGLAAGVFEEMGRFVCFTILLKKHNDRINSLMYGAGHGGIEAILLVGFTYINNIAFSLAINAGQADTMLSALDASTRATLESAFLSLSTTSPALFFVAGLERILAICLHIALSVLVFAGVKEKKFGYVLLAVGMHALVDAAALILNNYFGIAALECTVFFLVLLAAIVAYKIYQALPSEDSVYGQVIESTADV